MAQHPLAQPTSSAQEWGKVCSGIADLNVNAADTMSPGRSRTYTLSASEMTLVEELIDSESGQVISWVIDRREARNTGTMPLTNGVVNASVSVSERLSSAVSVVAKTSARMF
mgnify:CR=1 FL=1